MRELFSQTDEFCHDVKRDIGLYLQSVMPKFHYIYLAQNLLKARSPTCFEQVSDMSQTSQRPIKSRGPGRRQVDDKFSTNKVGNLVSDLSATWSPTSRRSGLRQDRSHGIWSLLTHKQAPQNPLQCTVRRRIDLLLIQSSDEKIYRSKLNLRTF